jgi:hypothetical protein
MFKHVEMFSKGDWVEFTQAGKTLKGFVIVPDFVRTTVETLGENYQLGKPYKKALYNVPNIKLTALTSDLHPRDKEMLVDMALSINDKEWFNSLTGSLARQL